MEFPPSAIQLIIVFISGSALLSFENSFSNGQEPPSSENSKKPENLPPTGRPINSQDDNKTLAAWERKSIEARASKEQREYELSPVKNITEVPGPGDIPYLLKHPRANTDLLSEEGRLAICIAGFDVLKDNEQKKVFHYLKDVPTKKLKAYVLVDSLSEDTSDSIIIVSAYECPTSPPSYIHVNYDDGEDKPPLYQVIFKLDREDPDFKKVLTYQLKLVEKIYPANIEEITSVPPSSIESSLYDTDALSDDQRLQMCRRAIRSQPELDIKLFEDEKPGISQYYVTIIRAFRKTRRPKNFQVIMQSFECPSYPKLYIHVNSQENGRNLWAIMKKRPSHDIFGFEILPVKSIAVYEGMADEKYKHLIEGKHNLGPLEDETEEYVEISQTIEESETIEDSRPAYVMDENSESEDDTTAERSGMSGIHPRDRSTKEDILIEIKKEDDDGSAYVEKKSFTPEKSKGKEVATEQIEENTRITASEEEDSVDSDDLMNSDEEELRYIEQLLSKKHEDATEEENMRIAHIMEHMLKDDEDDSDDIVKKVRLNRQKKGKVREMLKRLKIGEKNLSRVSREIREMGFDFTKKRNIIANARIEIEDEEERIDLCRKAIEAVSGRPAEITNSKTGPSKFYKIKGKFIWLLEPNVLKAFQCPSKPLVWIHIAGRDSLENTVWVIVEGEQDLDYFTKEFKK